MFITQLSFECFDNTTLSAVESAINRLLDALRYNGQILGREFFLVQQENGRFEVRVNCPEANSMHPKFHSDFVKRALADLTQAKLLAPKVRIIGRDIHSEQTAEEGKPSWQILYTTYVHTCSPLRSGEYFLPIPLYRYPATFNGDHKAIIHWQTQWQACDELQITGSCGAEFAALREISELDAQLFQTGWDLRGRIEYLTQVPTYYYQYRVGGHSLASEEARLCPKCQGHWRLTEPLHELFHFKCDSCRLVSNLAWDQLRVEHKG